MFLLLKTYHSSTKTNKFLNELRRVYSSEFWSFTHTDWHSFSLKLTVMSEQKSKETYWLFYYFCCVKLRKLAAEPTSSSFSMPKNLPNSAYSKYPSLLSCLLSLWRRFTFIIDGNERACGPTTIEDHIFLIGFLSKDTFTRICSRMNNKVLKAFGHKIHP